jgi:hypothetical protein
LLARPRRVHDLRGCGDGPDEAIAAPMHGLDVAQPLGSIVERPAQLTNAYRQDPVAHGGLWPYRLEQLHLGDQLPSPAGELPQYGRGLGRQGDDAWASPQQAVEPIEAVRAEVQVGSRWEGGVHGTDPRCSHSLRKTFRQT